MSFRPALSLRACVGLGAVLAVAPLASGQSLLTFNGQVVATTNDSVPGVAGALFGGGGTFDSGVLDDAGNILFRGRFTSGGATAFDDRGLFFGSTRENLQLAVRSGGLELTGTIPGATMNTASGTGLGSSYRISSTGVMMFGATLYDGNVLVTTANDTLLYHGTPGNFQILVREGDPAVGTIGATFSSSFSSPSQQMTGLIGAGHAYFVSTLAGGDVVGTTNNSGLFTGTPGNLVLVARKGDFTPAGEQLAGVTSGFVAQMNAQGQIVYDVSFVVGTGTTPVTPSDDRALWLYTPGVGSQQLIREGDASPITGATYNVGSNSWSINTGASTFNSSSEIALRVDLSGPSITTGVNDMAIVRISPFSQQVIMQRGDAAPGLPGVTLEVVNNTSITLTDAGSVAFQTSLGGSVTAADDTAIFSGTVGALQLVAREGDVAPGTGGGTFGSVSGQSQMMNGVGQLLFNNTLSGGTNPGSSLWSWDPVRGLQAVVLSGDSIEVQPTVFDTVTSQGGVQFNNGAARPLSFSDDGTATLRIGFTSGISAIMKTSVGSLFATPTTISTTSGGTQKLYCAAGHANANNTYLVLGSASGTTPGFFLGSQLLPLNPDTLLILTLTYPNNGLFTNTLGTLDAQGRAIATINIPAFSPGGGLTLNWAYITLDNLLNPVFASQAAKMIAVL